MRLILWDVDGTLIDGGRVAGAAMRAAMTQVFGTASNQDRLSYAGKTDQQIVLETFAEQDPAALLAQLPQFTAAYEAALGAERAALLERGRVLPGVVAALEQATAQGAINALLTGNLVSIARLKLETLAIAEHFDFAASAFGSDDHRRTELVPIARARATARYGPLAAEQVTVVGDTPHDIGCARAGHARAVAVATGPFSLAELLAHAPDAALPDLTDTDAVLAAVFG